MASGFTNVEVDTWLEVIPQVGVSASSTLGSDNGADNCPHTNTKQ